LLTALHAVGWFVLNSPHENRKLGGENKIRVCRPNTSGLTDPLPWTGAVPGPHLEGNLRPYTQCVRALETPQHAVLLRA